MRGRGKTLAPLAAALILLCAGQAGRCDEPAPRGAEDGQAEQRTHILRTGDEVTIWVNQAPEINDKPIRIDANGSIHLPLAGRVRAAGLTVEQLEAELRETLKRYIRRPEVIVRLTQPFEDTVSVIGAVGTPGVYKIRQPKPLVEVLSMAGGIRPDAGARITVIRQRDMGPIPMPESLTDASGASTATMDVPAVLEARGKAHNLLILPHDTISVARAKLVYVVGEVKNAGGFPMAERDSISVLQAVALAGGLSPLAAPKKARILRLSATARQRSEIQVDLKQILGAHTHDVQLLPDDILFVPTNKTKGAFARGAEAALQVGTGLLIYRR